MDHQDPDRPGDEERKPDDKAPAPKRPRAFLFLFSVLATLILIALIISSNASSNVERDRNRVYELLANGRLDGTTVSVVSQEGLIRGEIKLTDEEMSGDSPPPRSFRVEAVTEKAVDEFRSRVDEHNKKLLDEGDKVGFESQVSSGFYWDLLVNLLLLFCFIFILYFLFFRQLRGGGPAGSLFSFGKSRARLAEKGDIDITFDDVAGITEAKEEVQELIEFLKNPDKFRRLGGRIPRGVMLAGAPGTGKTLLAKAIAGEADVPFFSISGSDFVEMFVGVGASRVRDLFKQASQSSPCIVFLDEIDAVGRRRGAGLGGGHDEREQTLNAILVEMDGFSSDSTIVVVAATNRPDVLDPALLRPGRFDREIFIDLPDVEGREQILRVHTKKVTISDEVDLRRVAQLTPTFSGAELAALVNEAAIRAAMEGQDAVVQEDLEYARDKIRWGREKKSRKITEEDRKITAYHEAGHALVAHLLPEVDSLHKVTIIPRGMALGATMQMSEQDRYHYTRSQLRGELMVFFAGRIAEKMFCDDISAGAQNEIERATSLARRMVCEWGMSDAIGPINYSENQETLFLGREVTKTRNHSESMAQKIDEEVSRIIDQAYQKTEKLIRKHRDAVDRIAKALLRKETLSGGDVEFLVQGGEAESLGESVADPVEKSVDPEVEEARQQEPTPSSPSRDP